MVTYKNMQIPFMPQNFFNEMKADVKRNYVYIQIMGQFLEKLFPEVEFEFPQCAFSYFYEEDAIGFKKYLYEYQKCLCSYCALHTSFGFEIIKVQDIQKKYGISDITEENLRGEKRQQTIDEIRKSGMLENDIIKNLFFHLPDPVLQGVQRNAFSVEILYAYSYRVEEYLKFMSQHKSLIQHKFSAEHKQILHLLNFVSNAMMADSYYTYCYTRSAEMYIIGAVRNGFPRECRYNFNFFLALFILEKLLDDASDEFHF